MYINGQTVKLSNWLSLAPKNSTGPVYNLQAGEMFHVICDTVEDSQTVEVFSKIRNVYFDLPILSVKPFRALGKIPEILQKPTQALSWKQPYGTAMFCGKEYESRTWKTTKRGLILVCTSLKPYEFKSVLATSGHEQYRRLNQAVEGHNTRNLNGYAIGVVNVVDCFPMEIQHENEAFVRYDPDLFIWKCENPKLIKPFPLKGQMGFMNLAPEIIAKIEYI